MFSEGLRTSIVVISDRVENSHRPGEKPFDAAPRKLLVSEPAPSVVGSYLERLPLTAIRSGLVEFAEIWHHSIGHGSFHEDSPHLARRIFPLRHDTAPFHSETMLDFIRMHGAPRILCIWGLGVSEAMLDACRDSIIIYNSIDAPALRVPPEISRHFDIVLTGAEWQSDLVRERHPDMITAIMPIGPEFASPETFFPTGDPKQYDIIYVAAAQAYKRHDVLFDAMARAPRRLTALCVMGYGEDAAALRQRAHDLDITVDFIDPPGVPYSEVNRLMNAARVGVVCGVEDGAPAIITEYMLAGLPVVANADLACGLQYILPETGIAAPADSFEQAIIAAIDHPERFSPREAVLARWAWPHTAARFESLIAEAIAKKSPTADRQGASFEPAA
ncbi:glycosyltransferase family 4 protein [Devosia sp. Leaf64]|uniref:glycosyltransferase family 4 protein n=1 Tax=Devosia sp. Leaf64 TaxID=1736229 RepID=UPI000ABDB08B|nr:glycosyltransferase family 4 protein [Devosia sp. Leaf64]